MSLARRRELLEWARRNDAWIVEDDYLSELQLQGRAAPALASLEHGGRVLHIGTFSKTISPAPRLGFVVVRPELADRFGELAACLAPAPLSPWYAQAPRPRGLLLGVTNVDERRLAADCRRLAELVRQA